MIDELKQDLLVQYLLNEVDSSTAEKIRANSKAMPSFGNLCGKRRMPSPRWPTPHRRWSRPRVFLNEFFSWNGMSPGRPAPASRPKSSGWLFPGPWRLALPSPAPFCGLERTRLHKETEEVGQELLAVQQKNAQIEEELATLQNKNVFAEIKIATLEGASRRLRDGICGRCLGQRPKEWGSPAGQIASTRSGKGLSIVGDRSKNRRNLLSAGVLAVPNEGLIRAASPRLLPSMICRCIRH